MKFDPAFIIVVVGFELLTGNNMVFSEIRFSYPFILLMFSRHILKYPEAAAMDTITPGIHLNISATIVSAGEMFELGFYQPANSMSYYVAIMYKNILEDRVVWIANRDYPVTASAFFCIGNDGNLAIRQGRIIYMVTDLQLTNANVSATLLDSGNLVFRDENSSILWQSFDFPSHTFLPGMKLGYDRRIGKTWSYVSWRSSNDPSPGNFTLQLDPGPEKRIVILNGDEIYWRSTRPWGDDSNFFEFPPESRMNMYNFTFVSESDTAYLTYTLYRNDTISRFTLDATGQLRQVLWFENEWSLLNSQPRQPCDVYAYCGANSSCSNALSPFCSCLPGSEPSSAELWSNGDFKDGCSRKNDLQCGMEGLGTAEDGFHELSNVKLPENQLTVEVQSTGECRSACWSNCSCSGFSYTDGNCSTWSGDLINLQQLPADDISGTNFYLKLAASDSGTNKSTSNIRRAIILSVTVSMTIFGSALLIWQVKKKRDKRKGEGLDLLTFDITMSPARTEKKPAKRRRQVEHENEVEIPLFSFSSVCAATDNFSFSNKLGEGGFGPVYKAWDLWRSNKSLELMSTDLRDKYCPNAAARYINTALLCVEERASNRPTMSDVVMMLNNELTVLPSPVQPAFSNAGSGLDSSQSIPEISQNKLTVSVVVPR
ncbi:hypothetical protein V6N13_142395 [Hibiscus sabdariffa]